METNRGPRGEGEDSVEKRWRGAPTIIGRVGLPRSLTIIDPHSPRRREWIQTLSISYYAFLLYLSLPPLAPKRWRKLYRCASQIWFHSSRLWMDRWIHSILPPSGFASIFANLSYGFELLYNNLLLFFFKTLSRSSLLIIRATNVDIFMIYL